MIKKNLVGNTDETNVFSAMTSVKNALKEFMDNNSGVMLTQINKVLGIVEN
jgi:hypothetical protein